MNYPPYPSYSSGSNVLANTGTYAIAEFAVEQADRISELEREVEILKLVVLEKITRSEYQSLLSQFDSKDEQALVLAGVLLEELKKREPGHILK